MKNYTYAPRILKLKLFQFTLVPVLCGIFFLGNTNEIGFVGKSQTPSVRESKETGDCLPFDFHFIETKDVMYSMNIRNVEIFLDKSAFTKENLTRLFRYLSSRKTEPEHLSIAVYTDWSQMELPTDCPIGGISGSADESIARDHHLALYSRRSGGREFFRYNPDLKTDKFEVVVISK